MTENTGSVHVSQGDITSNPVVNAVQTADVYHANPVSNNERLLTQSEVNDLVGRSKHDAVERYKRSLERSNDTYDSPSQNISSDKIQQMVSDATTREIERLRTAYQEKIQNEQSNQVASDIISKITAAKDKYPDLEEKLEDIPIDRFVSVFEIANQVDNTADVLHYLVGKPALLAKTRQAIEDYRDPKTGKIGKYGLKVIQEISDRIKDNEQAAKQKLPPEPLRQMRPTKNNTDSGKLTVQDYKLRFRA